MDSMEAADSASGDIRHLFFRAGFGMTPAQIRQFTSLEVDEVVDYLLKDAENIKMMSIADQPSSMPAMQSTSFLGAEMESFEDTMSTEEELEQVRNQWIRQMVDGPDLHEKMVYFWHCHFACYCPSASMAGSYLNSIRKHALGNYRDLVLAIAREPAMLYFLNNQQNRKEKANENFARELMELYTLGEGHFTESDVQSAARAFTGWSSDENGFVFRPNLHDFGDKTFRGQTGPWDGEDIIRIIIDDRRAAEFLAISLYRFFVNDQIDDHDIRLLADYIYEQDYDIAATMSFLLRSDFFYDEANRAVRIKSPIELIVHLMKLCDIRFAEPGALTFLQNAMGQTLMDPPNVAGWPGGRSWIDNATLMLRLNLGNYLLNDERFDVAPVTSLKASGPAKVIQKLNVDHDLDPVLGLFGGSLNRDLEQKFKEALLANPGNKEITSSREQKQLDYRRLLVLRITSLPEFQLC